MMTGGTPISYGYESRGSTQSPPAEMSEYFAALNIATDIAWCTLSDCEIPWNQKNLHSSSGCTYVHSVKSKILGPKHDESLSKRGRMVENQQKPSDLAQISDFQYSLECIDPIAPNGIIQEFVVPQPCANPVAAINVSHLAKADLPQPAGPTNKQSLPEAKSCC